MTATWDTIDRYLIISADTHAGADLREYRDYLDPQWYEEFDAWAATYSSPYDDLVDATAYRNWDSEKRLQILEADGITAEVTFPNTIPPFYNTIQNFASLPWTREDFERRVAGLQAHNRWLVDFCNKAPGRRRGLIQIFPHDVDLAMAEIQWAKDTGVIAGIVMPPIPPNHDVEPWFHLRYEPMWSLCEDLDMPVHQHAGTGGPDKGFEGQPGAGAIMLVEMGDWTLRTITHLILGGVFERHPRLKAIWTEAGSGSAILAKLASLDVMVGAMKSSTAGNRTLPMFGDDTIDALNLSPSEYWARNCWLGASFMSRPEVQFRYGLGIDRVMWGADFPHEEGTTPYSREALRSTFFDVPVEECRKMFGGNAAEVYGFDLAALTPVAQRVGPTVAEIQVPLDVVPADASSAAFAGTFLDKAGVA